MPTLSGHRDRAHGQPIRRLPEGQLRLVGHPALGAGAVLHDRYAAEESYRDPAPRQLWPVAVAVSCRSGGVMHCVKAPSVGQPARDERVQRPFEIAAELAVDHPP
jgi:hypothetical protein